MNPLPNEVVQGYRVEPGCELDVYDQWLGPRLENFGLRGVLGEEYKLRQILNNSHRLVLAARRTLGIERYHHRGKVSCVVMPTHSDGVVSWLAAVAKAIELDLEKDHSLSPILNRFGIYGIQRDETEPNGNDDTEHEGVQPKAAILRYKSKRLSRVVDMPVRVIDDGSQIMSYSETYQLALSALVGQSMLDDQGWQRLGVVKIHGDRVFGGIVINRSQDEEGVRATIGPYCYDLGDYDKIVAVIEVPVRKKG